MLKNQVTSRYEVMIDEMIGENDVPSLEERYAIIEELNEDFYQETGWTLPSFLLNKLTDWVLSETLKDRGVDKVANNEYAVLSHRQIKRRTKRETLVTENIIDYLDLKYAKNYDSLSKVTRKEVE